MYSVTEYENELENIFKLIEAHTEFMELKLVKENIHYRKCVDDVKKLLVDAGFTTDNDKDLGVNYQYRLKFSNEIVGYLRFYPKKDNSTTIDDSQIIQSWKKKVRDSFSSYLKLEAFKRGTLPLGTRHLIDEAVTKNIKDMFASKFPELKNTGIKDQIFDYRLEGSNLVVTQYKAGSLYFQGKQTEFSDKVLKEVDRLIQDRQRILLLNIVKEQVDKESYDEIEKALSKRQITLNEYVSPALYWFFSGSGSHLLQDGLAIFEVIKEKQIQLKDYGSIIRNFGILFEDFLINWMLDLSLIKIDDLKVDTRLAKIGNVIHSNVWETKYKHCYSRIRPQFVEKLKSAYQEGRHDLLHSDKFRYEPITSIEKAYAKRTLILECMEDCIRLFLDELNIKEDHIHTTNKKILGTDESGKGDYFGALIVAGVLIENQETEEQLRQIGVQDSKNVSDRKAIELAEQITRLCKVDFIRINPEKYNQLYNEIGNLNKLLGWGHARVIENIAKHTLPDYVIADKFGDDLFITSKLMEYGKKVKLIQRVRAEENIAVAAASIIARANFLLSLQEISFQYNLEFPKGASDIVIEKGKEFVLKNGKEELRKVAKIHFRTTDKIIC